MEFIVRIFLCLSLFTIAVQCQSIKGRTLIVTSVLEEPYTMLRKPNGLNLTGNDRFEGFVVDLVKEMSTVLGFDYELRINEAIGSFNKTAKEWTGMIGEIVDGRADIAAGPITITAERESAVDFTAPFMELGISILYRRREKAERVISDHISDLFRPLENWETIISFVLTLIFGIVLLVLRRKYKTIFFRILLALWLLCLFVFMALFIAMLSGHYVRHDGDVVVENYAFENVEDLARQSNVAYGCVRGGTTESFFRNAEHSTTYGIMWSRMQARDPSPFVRSNEEGTIRILEPFEDYAFLAESTYIEYMTARNCELTQIGGLLDSKGYGLALRRGSPIREILNRVLLKLQEKGFLVALKKRWWHNGNLCSDVRVPPNKRHYSSE